MALFCRSHKHLQRFCVSWFLAPASKADTPSLDRWPCIGTSNVFVVCYEWSTQRICGVILRFVPCRHRQCAACDVLTWICPSTPEIYFPIFVRVNPHKTVASVWNIAKCASRATPDTLKQLLSHSGLDHSVLKSFFSFQTERHSGLCFISSVISSVSTRSRTPQWQVVAHTIDVQICKRTLSVSCVTSCAN